MRPSISICRLVSSGTFTFCDRLNERRRYERKFRQARDVAFGESFAARDLDERTDAAGRQFLEPSSSPCECLQQRRIGLPRLIASVDDEPHLDATSLHLQRNEPEQVEHLA